MAEVTKVNDDGTVDVRLSKIEADAVTNLAKRQDLGFGRIILQALRTYQSAVHPLERNGPFGCMGD